MKSMVILGSTGSIGTQALDVARLRNFTVKALTSNSNIDLLEKQIREFKPEIAAVADESRAAELRIKVADTDTKVAAKKAYVPQLSLMPIRCSIVLSA